MNSSSWQTCSAVPVPFSGPPVLLWVRIAAYLMLPQRQQQEQQMLQVATTAAVCLKHNGDLLECASPFLRLFYAPPGWGNSSSFSSFSSSVASAGASVLSPLAASFGCVHAPCLLLRIYNKRNMAQWAISCCTQRVAPKEMHAAYASCINLVLNSKGLRRTRVNCIK